MAGKGHPVALVLHFVDLVARAEQGGMNLRFRFADDAGAHEAPAGIQMLFQRRGQHTDHGGQDVGDGEGSRGLRQVAIAIDQPDPIVKTFALEDYLEILKASTGFFMKHTKKGKANT